MTRPVDFQTAVPKLTDLGRQQQAQERHWQVRNDHFAAELQQRSRSQLKQVNTAKETGPAKTDKDGGKKPPPERRQAKREKTRDPQGESGASLGSHLDVRT